MCSVPSIKVFTTLSYISIISQSLHINALEWDPPIWHPRMLYGIKEPPQHQSKQCHFTWRHQAITETHVSWPLLMTWVIHPRAIPQGMLNISMCDISMYLRLQPHLPMLLQVWHSFHVMMLEYNYRLPMGWRTIALVWSQWCWSGLGLALV